MVQRKASTLQPLKTETLFQQQDIIKNSNTNLKKKIMKKSGKPPPIGKTPNYMKPTSSSDARKEQSLSPVSLRRKSSDNGGKKATNETLFATKNHPSFKPARKCSPVVLCEDLDAQRATCSSTLKDCKFPAYLSLNSGGTESEGTSAIKVCPYTYCSLNGHHRAPPPQLKCFLSARRRMIKTQRTIKLGCLSPRRPKPDEKNDFFIEICINKDEDDQDQEQQVSETLSDAPVYDDFDDAVMMDGGNTYLSEGVEVEPEVQCEDSDMDWEKGYQSSLHLDFDFDYDYEFTPVADTEPDPEESAEDDDLVNSSDKKDCSFDPLQVSQELCEESLISDAFSIGDDDGESTDCYHHMENLNSGSTSGQFEPSHSHDEEEHILSETPFDNQSHQSIPNEDDATESNLENSDEDFITGSTVVSGKEAPSNEGDGDHRQDELEHEIDETVLARVTAKFKKSVEEGDDLGSFNPRGPNFLPLEVEPDGEKVDLRHQDLDERKNAEEWMVDYALRQVVTKLGPARNRRVSLLVEAFEKVMPIKKCDDVHLRHTSAFDQAWPLQTCI